MPWHLPFTKKAMYDCGPSVGNWRTGVCWGCPIFPLAVDGRFLTVADFFVDDGTGVELLVLLRSFASMRAIISFD